MLSVDNSFDSGGKRPGGGGREVTKGSRTGDSKPPSGRLRFTVKTNQINEEEAAFASVGEEDGAGFRR